MTDGREVAVMGVTTLLGGVSDNAVRVASFLQEEAEGLKGMAKVVADWIAAVEPSVVGEDKSVAMGTNGLASTLRADPTAVAGGCVPTENTSDGLVDEFGTEVPGEAGTPTSARVDLVREAVAREGVQVTGIGVCESGVQPGGVCRTESRKEKVWETGLRLSPLINAKLSSPARLPLNSGLPAKTFC